MGRKGKRKSSSNNGTPKGSAKKTKMPTSEAKSGKDKKDLDNNPKPSNSTKPNDRISEINTTGNTEDTNNNATVVNPDLVFKNRDQGKKLVEGQPIVRKTLDLNLVAGKNANQNFQKDSFAMKLVDPNNVPIFVDRSEEELGQAESPQGGANHSLDFEQDGIQITVNASEDQFDSDSDSDMDTARDEPGLSRSQDQDSQQSGSFWENLKNEPEAMGFINNLIEQKLKEKEKAVSKPKEGKIKSNDVGTSPLQMPGAIKATSMSTLYKPALIRDNLIIPNSSPKTLKQGIDSQAQVFDPISKFISDVRENTPEPRPGTSRDDENGFRRRQELQRPEAGPSDADRTINRARTEAEKIIVDAERFKAAIAPPQGMSHNNLFSSFTPLQLQRLLDTDDDFFHVASHVEPNLLNKVQLGQYVELEKMRPKNSHSEDGNKMELVNRNGLSYWVEKDREAKINNVKKWDEAFRIYSTIYTQAHPERAVEILQYVDTIHVAAASYAWENVYKYDKKFRQLMAAKPHRSWAKTYTHMWNLCLTEPINRNFGNQGFSQGYNSNNNNTSGGRNRQGNGRDNVCWKFNKNKCNRGSNCRFDHKCSYCGGASHGYFQCNKRQKRSSNDHQGKTDNQASK